MVIGTLIIWGRQFDLVLIPRPRPALPARRVVNTEGVDVTRGPGLAKVLPLRASAKRAA